MKFVLLTNKGSLFGKQVLKALNDHQIEIKAVVVIKQPLRYHWRLFRSVQKRIGLYDACYFSVKRILESIITNRKTPINKNQMKQTRLSTPVFFTRGTNSEGTRNLLKSLCPDICILGQTGVVSKEILEIPKKGTLNVHPGILPAYRGIDCAKWAILNGEFDKVGVTVHWVHRGIDTGPILAKRVYPFKREETIETLNQSLYRLCVSMLIQCLSLLQSGTIPPEEPQSLQEGKQYYKMPKRLEKITRMKLEEFLGQTIGQ